MGLRAWIDRYVVSVGPSASRAGEIDPAAVPLLARGKVSALDLSVDEARLGSAAGEDAGFQDVFAAARIEPPAHGFTVEKVAGMLRHPKLSGLTREARAAAVLVALEAQGVQIETVLSEAARKDKALDVFEKVQRERAAACARQKDEENARLAAQIEANKAAAAELSAKVEAWVARKNAKEAELHEVAAHFTTDNPVTLSETPRPASSGATVKLTDLTG